VSAVWRWFIDQGGPVLVAVSLAGLGIAAVGHLLDRRAGRASTLRQAQLTPDNADDLRKVVSPVGETTPDPDPDDSSGGGVMDNRTPHREKIYDTVGHMRMDLGHVARWLGELQPAVPVPEEVAKAMIVLERWSRRLREETRPRAPYRRGRQTQTSVRQLQQRQ
jgi:hypothetical protein